MALVKLSALALAAACGQVVAASPQRKPHVLFILADDYGWANFGPHRREASRQARLETHTPNIDSLVSEGVLLDRHYAYSICSPSRSSLQSGRLPVHVNIGNTGVTIANLSDPESGAAGIPRSMTGLATKLREGGYRTHMVGKWDAGMATPDHTPYGRGYESFVGYFQHANNYWRKNAGIMSTGEVDICLNSFTDLFMHNSTYRGGVRDSVSMSPACLHDPNHHPACYEEFLFKERALAVVREHDTDIAAAPLFLFYAFHLLHSPLQVPESYLTRIDELIWAGSGDKIDTQNRRLYAAMILYMDEVIGELVEALKTKGMWDNTLVVFSSDNGGAIYEPGSANNHPLRGGKYSDFEGGVRVNAFVSGGLIPQDKRGTVHSGIISIADWYGTLCELAGVDSFDYAAARANELLRQQGLPLLPAVDSVAQWGFIVNGTNGRPSLHLSENAFISWPFKLLTGKQTYSKWQGELFPNCSSVEAADAGEGPVYDDLKVFNVVMQMGRTEEDQEKLTWVHDCQEGCLFNVEADPTEHLDLASDPAHAQILADMRAELRRLNAGNFKPARGTPSVEACEAGIANGGFFGPFIDSKDWYSPVPPRTPVERLKAVALQETIRVLNQEMIEKGVTKVAQQVMPWIQGPWTKALDKCTMQEVATFVV